MNPNQPTLNPCPLCGGDCEEGNAGDYTPKIDCSQCSYLVMAPTGPEVVALHNSIKPPCVWRKEFPDEQAYWWWVAAEEAGPVIVGIFGSGTDNSYFAHQGQLGWKEFRLREWFEKNYPDSLWMKVDLPAHPNSGGEI